MTVLERASVCTLDCPDTCSLTVEVEGDRIVKVRGSDALPYTGGIICNKVGRYSTEFARRQPAALAAAAHRAARLGPVRAGWLG